MKTLYKNVKATVEVTGQKIIGNLLYEEMELEYGLYVEKHIIYFSKATSA